MKNAKIIAVANNKGGVGKTTVTLNFGYALAEQGYRILLVDIDPQANLTKGLGIIDCKEEPHTICEPIWGVISQARVPASLEYIKHRNGIDFIPANNTLSVLEIAMAGIAQRDGILRSILSEMRESYDYIIVDCPPSPGLLTINALIASDSVLIVTILEDDSTEGVKMLMELIALAQKNSNRPLPIDGILINRVDPRLTLSRKVTEDLSALAGSSIRIFDTQIPEATQFGLAKKEHISIFEYVPRKKKRDQVAGAAAYRQFVKEYLGRGACVNE